MDGFLAAAQARAYTALTAYTPSRFFLRRSRGDDCLWVSDLSRHVGPEIVQAVNAALRVEGFEGAVSKETGLLHMDLSLAGYEALLGGLVRALPPFPSREAYHSAYGLCRLLFLHPAPLHQQPLAPLRSMLKACSSLEPMQVFQLIPGVHEKCAVWLREGKPLPHGAGLVLGAWISQQERALDGKGGVG